MIAINNAKEIPKSTGINISVISTDTGISRKTFYNNNLLKAYVEDYSIVNLEKDTCAIDFEKIKTKNDDLIKQIDNFVLRDIETDNLRHKIKELYAEIQNLQSRNISLEHQYEQVQAELS